MKMSILGRLVSLGCFYDRCPYYKQKPHPETNHTCEWGHPSCLKGKIDYQISLVLFTLDLYFFLCRETVIDKFKKIAVKGD